jgi:hypothetical protein
MNALCPNLEWAALPTRTRYSPLTGGRRGHLNTSTAERTREATPLRMAGRLAARWPDRTVKRGNVS